MINQLFKAAADRHEAIVKAAFVGAMLGGIGRLVARNPLKTLGGVMYASDVASGAKKMTSAAGRGLASAAPALQNTF